MVLLVPPSFRTNPTTSWSPVRCFKTNNWIVFTSNPVTSQTRWMNPCMSPSKRVSQISTTPWVLWIEAQLVSKARYFGGFMSLAQVPRDGVPDVGHKPFPLQGEALGLRDPSPLCVAGWGFLVRPYLSLSYPSWCGPFILCCGGRCLVSFQFFLSRNYSIFSCIFGVSIGGDEFLVFLCCHLGPSLYFCFDILIYTFYFNYFS